jgi:hypothetical protein
VLAVCCRSEFGAVRASGRGCDEAGRPIAMGRAGVARLRSNDAVAVVSSATASMVIADQEPAQQKCSTGMSHRTRSDHDVSILIAAAAAGRLRGEEPRWNVSMMTMRPPQHGHGCESGLGSAASAQLVSPALGCAGTSSKRRALATLSARVPLASRP